MQTINGQNDDVLYDELEYLKEYANRFILKGSEGTTHSYLLPSDIIPPVTGIEADSCEMTEILRRTDASLPISQESVESAFYLILMNISQAPPDVCKRLYKTMESTKSLIEIVELIEDMKCPLQGVVSMQDVQLTKAILERRLEINETESSDSVDVAVKLLDVPNIEALMHHGEGRMHRVYRFFDCLKEIALDRKENLKTLTVLVEKIPEWNIWDEVTVGMIGDLFEQAYEDALTIFLQHKVHLYIKNVLNVDVIAHGFGNANPGVISLMKKLVADGYSPKLGLFRKCALHFAMKACIFENVMLLQKRVKISPNHRDAMGRTPLFEVFNSDQNVDMKLDCVSRLLIFCGADVQVFDHFQENLLDYHRNDDDWKVIQFILAHLAMFDSFGRCSVDERIRFKISSTQTFANYYATCHQQLEDMKKTRLCKGVTVYTLLTANFSKSLESLWLRAEALKLLTNRRYFRKLSFYYVIKLRTHIIYYESMDNCRNIISSIICECFEIFAPYPLIVDKIVSYLPVEYLKTFNHHSN